MVDIGLDVFLQRVRYQLRKKHQVLRRNHGRGYWWVEDQDTGALILDNVDIESWGRESGFIKHFERLVS